MKQTQANNLFQGTFHIQIDQAIKLILQIGMQIIDSQFIIVKLLNQRVVINNSFVMNIHQKPAKSQIVQFSKLDQNNKTQFLQFLIKNNISFEQGRQNYTAKVTIKNTINNVNNSTPKRNRSRSKSVNNIHQGKVNKQTPQATKKILHNKTLSNANVLSKASNMYSPAKQSLKTPQKVKQKQRQKLSIKQKQNCTPKQSKVNLKSQKTKQNLNNQSAKRISLTNRQKSSQKVRNKSLKKQKSNESSPFIKGLKSNIKKREDNFLPFQVQQKPILSPIIYKKKQSDRSQLINKYVNYFTSNYISVKQRPIRWSVHQLQKQIQEIYDECFTKNTHMLNSNSSKLTEVISSKLNLFALSVQNVLKKKFKCNKLVEYNLTNILYSISYYTLKGIASLQIQMFQLFLTQHYEFEDFMFFLFARNIILKGFKKSFDRQFRSENTNFASLKNNSQFMSHKEITKFIRLIVGKDSQLLNEYQKIIFQKIQTNQIQIDRLLSIVLEDYKTKRISTFYDQSKSNSVNQFIDQQSPDNAFQNMNIGQTNNSVDELTFGEDTKELQNQNNFWQCQDNLFIKLDQFNEMIAQKLLQKTNELICILANGSLNQAQIEQIEECLYKKSLGLFMTVVEMNKLKWLRQLHIQNPSKQDIQKVQQIQLYFRKIKNQPTAKDIAEFCKMILTVEQITQELSKFFL